MAVYVATTTDYQYGTTGLPLVAFFVFCGIAMLSGFYFMRKKGKEAAPDPEVTRYRRTAAIDARIEAIKKIRNRSDQEFY